MQSFFALSGISTRETYFERYQSVWDIMVTVKDTDVDSFSEAQKLRAISGIRSAIVYQKAMAKRIIAEDEISEDMKSFGGFAVAGDNYVRKTDGGWLVNVPIVILDDASFLAYCEQIGITPQLNGAVIWNQIRDVTNPDFRHPRYMPYVKGENAVSILRQSGKEENDNGNLTDVSVEIPVLSYTEKVPVLREEYATIDYYELVHFMPVSLWKEIKGQIGGSEEDTYICMLGRKNVTAEELDALQGQVDSLIGGNYKTESENRIQEAEVNDKQIHGMVTIFGGFCVLLAMIGIGNVFSNTLGFVRQRKREFARYMSVGMTQGEIKKMFCVEALTIAGRPILITLPLAVVTVGYMLKLSYVEVGTFLAEAPLIPIMIFMLSIWGIVAFAYYLGWRNIRKIDLAEVLRDDTMM
jgi:putative ABC transport system permease protein